MAQPEFVENHYEDGVDLTPSQFKDKANYQAFLRTYLDMVQELERVFYNNLFKDLAYNRLSGDVLEKSASVFGVRRSVNESDDSLRIRLVARILARTSDSTPDKLKDLITAFAPNLVQPKVFEHFPLSTLSYAVNTDPAYSFSGQEANIVQTASPLTTGSVVVGFIDNSEEHLLIPTELGSQLRNLTVNFESSGVVNDYNIALPDGASGLDTLTARLDEQINNVVASDNAILPEVGIRQETFKVQTSDGTNDFKVNSPPDLVTEMFNIETAGVENNRGICLETNQIDIPRNMD